MHRKYAVKRGGAVQEIIARSQPRGSLPWPDNIPEGHTVTDIVGAQAVIGPVPEKTDAEIDADATALRSVSVWSEAIIRMIAQDSGRSVQQVIADLRPHYRAAFRRRGQRND